VRVAVIHEWLVDYSGSERTLEQILLAYPQADLFALVDFLPKEQTHFLHGRTAQTSFIQSLPFARKSFRNYLALFPLAVEQFDLSKYDLVISNSHSVAKGAIVGPGQFHVCYCSSPIRYAWDMRHEYLREAGITRGLRYWLAQFILHRLRIWDAATAHSVDKYIANSKFVASRIRKFYGRDAVVIHPPVDIELFTARAEKEDFYLVASRQVPYKKIHLIVEAFRSMPHRQLVVIGDGPEASNIAKLAEGYPNIRLLGYQSSVVLKDYMQRAKAFVFAAKEDFGIILLEAQACGTPVIAYAEGGALETVIPEGSGQTGMFFDEQSSESIIKAIQEFEAGPAISSAACRANAEAYTPQNFRAQLRGVIETGFEEYRAAASTRR